MAVGVHRHFNSRWFRQNARSNAGVTPPGALGVQQHRAVRAAQDILRADIAVDQGVLVGLGLGQGYECGARSGCAWPVATR